MKTMIVSGLTLALLTGAALAQSAPAQPPRPPGAADTGVAAPPPPPADAADAGPGAPPPPPPGGPRGHHPPPPSRGAHFILENGDRSLDVKCADDEPMQHCADIVMQLLDRLHAEPNP